MINLIENWIDKTNAEYASQRQTCIAFQNDFQGYFPTDFLQSAYFVIVDTVPKPNFLQLRKVAGMSDFLDMRDDGMAYKDTYYIARGEEHHLPLHFHELVHIVQWRLLGAGQFIQRYLSEVEQYRYEKAPLELMAYGLQECFEKGQKVDILQYVRKQL